MLPCRYKAGCTRSDAMKTEKIIKIKLEDLVPHEEFRPEHASELVAQIRNDKVLKRPIAVYDLGSYKPGKYMIVDGHHRTEALKEMGLTYIPANVIDYFDRKIVVKSWNIDMVWDKKEIVIGALEGKLLKPKATKHIIVRYKKESPFQDNDYIEPLINYPLEELK